MHALIPLRTYKASQAKEHFLVFYQNIKFSLYQLFAETTMTTCLKIIDMLAFHMTRFVMDHIKSW